MTTPIRFSLVAAVTSAFLSTSCPDSGEWDCRRIAGGCRRQHDGEARPG